MIPSPSAERAAPEKPHIVERTRRRKTEATDHLSARAKEGALNPEALLTQRAAEYRANGTIERIGPNGRAERWNIVGANERSVVLEQGSKRRYLSRTEAALEERAAAYGLEVAKHWNDVITKHEQLWNDLAPTKPRSDIETAKWDLLEIAAMRLAADPHREAKSALFEVMHDFVAGEPSLNNAQRIFELERLTERLERTRFSDEHIAQYSAAENDATPVDVVATRLEITEKSVGLPESFGATARGEIAPHAVIDLAAAMSIEAINAEIRRAREARKGRSVADAIVAIGLEQQAYALAVNEETRKSPMELGAVQHMLTEMQRNAPPRRGRPVNIDQLSARHRTLQETNRATPYWSEAWHATDDELWEVEKRIIRANGLSELLHPENYSFLYRSLKEGVASGMLTRAEVVRICGEEDFLETTNARDREGAEALLREFATGIETSVDIREPATRANVEEYTEANDVVPDEAEDNGPEIDEEKLRIAKPKSSRRGPRIITNREALTDEDRENFDRTSPEVALGTLGKERREPRVGENTTQDFFDDGDHNEYNARFSTAKEVHPETYTPSFVTVADAFGGADALIKVFNELRAHHLIDFTLEDVSNARKATMFSRLYAEFARKPTTDTYIHRIQKAEQKLREREGLRMSDTFSGSKKGRGKIG